MKLRVLLAIIVTFGAGASIALGQANSPPSSTGGSAASAQIGSAAQATEREQAALADLLAAHPSARLYQSGNRPTRIYGVPLTHGASPTEAAEQFRLNHAEAVGVEPADLVPTTRILDSGNTLPLLFDTGAGQYRFTLVYYSQHRDGIPVFQSDLRILVRNEPDSPAVWVGSSLRRLGDFHPGPVRTAIDLDTAAWTAATGLTEFTEPETVIWAGVDDMVVEPRLAATFVGDNFDDPNADKPEKWRYVADFNTGEILYQESLILFTDVTGSVKGMATQGYKAEPCSPEVSTAMPYAKASIGSTTVYADINGNFTIPNGGTSSVTVSSPMSGHYFAVDDRGGTLDDQTKTVTPPGPANFVHNSANTSEYWKSEVNSYIHANVVRDWVVKYNPSYPTIPGQTSFPVRVNRNDGYCPGNAWYSGDGINFCRAAGAGYPNTGYSSVVYHEYGHHIVAMGGSGQDQYGEGMGDCVAALIADEATMAWGFQGNCSAGLRTADNTYQYPCSGEAHDCGNLLSACIWSTRNELYATHPTTYRDTIASLTLNSVPMHSGSTITPQITIDFLTLDDNDGDIYNGTPHAKEICAGFAAHSMNCPAGVLDPIAFQYPDGRPTALAAQEQKTFRVTVVSNGGNPVPGTGQLHYSTDGGTWTATPMTQTAPNEYQATLPATACRSLVSWYVSAQADDSNTYSDPQVVPSDAYTAPAGRLASVSRSDNFESAAGWTVGDTGDSATAGIWTLGIPEATVAQPGEDHTSFPWKKCWVTDNVAGGSANARDVDGGKTTLMSPTISLSGVTEPTISYWRWYSNSTGSAPNADVFTVDISNNNGTSWTNVETIGPSGPGTSGGWIRHAFRVADIITPTALMKIRFVASDTGADSTIEAAIDDFEVATYQCDTTAPTPNPPTWVTVPTPTSTTEITMEAYAADPSGVSYYFSVSGIGGHSRTWNANPVYTDTGLGPNMSFSYKVKARDGAQPTPNETAYSDPVAVATFIETPTGLSFGAVTDTSIEATALDSFSNLTEASSGLYFEVTKLDGTPVGGAQANAWIQLDPPPLTITATGLSPGTQYRFRVKAKNSTGMNETAWYPTSGYSLQSTTGQAACSLSGDVNQDGVVNGLDVSGFVRAKLGSPPEGIENQACANYNTGSLAGDVAEFANDLLGL